MAVKGELGEITPEQADAALRVLAPDPAGLPRRPSHSGPGKALRTPALRLAVPHALPTLAQAHHPHGPTHLYELTWNAPGMGGETLGACHGLGLPLTFGNLARGSRRVPCASAPAPPEAAALTAHVRATWTAFAATGDPGMARLRPARAAHLDHRCRTGRAALPGGDFPSAVG